MKKLSAGLGVECLEAREVPAAAFYPSTGALVVTPDWNGNPMVLAHEAKLGADFNGPHQFKVRLNGRLIGVDARHVKSITVNGTGGDDRIDLSAVNTGTFFSTALNNRIWLNGNAGEDQIFGSAFNDRIDGGAGNDGGRLYGLQGGAGNDTILGGGGDDRMDGGAGDDHLYGGAGRDHVSGGGGFDTLYDFQLFDYGHPGVERVYMA
jgi:hypothetical protein